MRLLTVAPRGDAFSYSSRRLNPVFRLLSWGGDVVEALLEREPDFGPEVLLRYEALFGALTPRTDEYWVKRFVRGGRWDFLEPEACERMVRFRERLETDIRTIFGVRGPGDRTDLPMVHMYPVPKSLTRWLKFGVGIWRADEAEMNRISARIERALDGWYQRPDS
jgi:hypothetical protein